MWNGPKLSCGNGDRPSECVVDGAVHSEALEIADGGARPVYVDLGDAVDTTQVERDPAAIVPRVARGVAARTPVHRRLRLIRVVRVQRHQSDNINRADVCFL